MLVPFVNTPELIPSWTPSNVILITLPITSAEVIVNPSPYTKLAFVTSKLWTSSGNSISNTECP